MAQLAVSELTAAGTALMRTGRWDAARQLLQAAKTDEPEEKLQLVLAEAEAAVDQDFAQSTDHGDAALAALQDALAQAPDATVEWDLGMLLLRKDYSAALFSSDVPMPDGHQPADAEALAQRAERLRDAAPDDGRAGLVTFYAGLIADQLRSVPADAFSHYTAALALAEKSGDEFLASLALRHLGDHAHTAGDLALARAQWERSTELRQKVGHLLGALAQQAVLAVLTRDEGDRPGAVALATEVNRWARQLQLVWLESQTTDFLKETVG
jgi:tetratricopeptide (TPR) repeat protein